MLVRIVKHLITLDDSFQCK